MTKCRWCDFEHGPRCPWVKAIEYHEDGVTVKRVEFLTPADCVTPISGFGFLPVLPLAPPAPIRPTPMPDPWQPVIVVGPNTGCLACRDTGICNCYRPDRNFSRACLTTPVVPAIDINWSLPH